MATEVLVPPLGQTVDVVTLISWYKEENKAVTQGEALFAIETDKATLDVEAPVSGVLHRVTAQPGDAVKVLSVIAFIAAPDEVLEETVAVRGPGYVPQKDVLTSLPSQATADGQAKKNGRRIFTSPRARRLIEQHGVSLVDLRATGPEGAIVERDVRAYLDTDVHHVPGISPVARRVAEDAGVDWRKLTGSGPRGRIMHGDIVRGMNEAEVIEAGVIEIIPVRGVRAVIGERMAHSVATTARVTLTAEADATVLVDLRRHLIEDQIKVSYNDLLLCILGRALRDHPRINASLEGDVIKVWQPVHIGLAVDTDRGLLVPVVRDVDRKGLSQLAGETQSLTERARSGYCTPEELSGGTFTLTNLGMFGIDAFTPIINLPECAILGAGRIKRQPVMVGDDVVGRQMVWLCLTFDHRLVDGGPAARFLQRVVQLVEHPHLLMA